MTWADPTELKFSVKRTPNESFSLILSVESFEKKGLTITIHFQVMRLKMYGLLIKKLMSFILVSGTVKDSEKTENFLGVPKTKICTYWSFIFSVQGSTPTTTG